MKTLLLAIAVSVLTWATPANAQDCRTNFGGVYTFAHSGIKPDGAFFSSLVSFGFRTDGTFDVIGVINKRGTGPFLVDAKGGHWTWFDSGDKCDLWVDREAFVGRVSFDGRFISFATFDDEQLAGVAIRDAP
jgi:hypothetical protein